MTYGGDPMGVHPVRFRAPRYRPTPGRLSEIRIIIMSIRERRRAVLARGGRREAPSSRDVARNALSGLAATLTGFAVMDRDATIGLMLLGGGILWMVLTVADIEEDTL